MAVVTGASRGIGKQIAIALAERGAATALVGRDAAALEDVRGSITGRGGRAESFVADVSEEAPVERLRDRVTESLGSADILINNAGIILRKRMLEFSSEEWNRLIQTNLTGPFLCARAFAPGMIARNFGRIVNITSIFSHVGYLDRSAYCASKTGLLGLTKALALELAPHNVTVNGVSPGPIATEMNTGQMAGFREERRVPGARSARAMGQARGGRSADGVPVLGRSWLYHGRRHPGGRRVDGAVNRD